MPLVELEERTTYRRIPLGHAPGARHTSGSGCYNYGDGGAGSRNLGEDRQVSIPDVSRRDVRTRER